LAAVNNVVAAQAVADVAALAVLNTSGLSAQDQVEVFNSTNIQTYNTTYPSAPQITGVPVGFVGATALTVNLVWTGSAWTWNSYSSTDPDNRYQLLDAGLTYLDGLNFTDETTFKQGVNLEIGVDVQAYDVNTAKLDSPQTFTASNTFNASNTFTASNTFNASNTFTVSNTFASDQTYPKIPANTKTAAYTLVVADAGKHINITTGGVTVPSSVFSIGDAVSIYNNSTSDQTITEDTGVTLRQVGTANTGNRTLAQYGVATLLCVASNTFVISGGGLS
jgi:hypothetical protein